MHKIDRFKGKFHFLSNFHSSRIEIYGFVWPTAEHAYQAVKSLNKDHWSKVLESNDPRHAKRTGRKAPLMRPDWDEIKKDVMRDVVYAKFNQNYNLRDKLLSTGETYLEEGNWWGDTYWGVCNGVGENHLGRILMYVREEMRL